MDQQNQQAARRFRMHPFYYVALIPWLLSVAILPMRGPVSTVDLPGTLLVFVSFLGALIGAVGLVLAVIAATRKRPFVGLILASLAAAMPGPLFFVRPF